MYVVQMFVTLPTATTTATATAPPPPPPQLLQYAAHQTLEHNLPPFMTVCDHCLPGFFLFPIYLSPLLPHHLSIFCIFILFFLFPPLQLLHFFLAFFSSPFLQHDHTIIVRENS
jgi:hypothetical protein